MCDVLMGWHIKLGFSIGRITFRRIVKENEKCQEESLIEWDSFDIRDILDKKQNFALKDRVKVGEDSLDS